MIYFKHLAFRGKNILFDSPLFALSVQYMTMTSVIHSNSLSHNCSENTSNINESSCNKCIEYELQLREALDELGSARKIIEILQKELSTYPSPNNVCRSDLISPKASDKPVNSTEWTFVPTRNYFPNPNNSNKHIAVPSNQTIKTANRFSLLHNLEDENMVPHGRQEQYKSTLAQNTRDTETQKKTGIKIPTIINGRLSFNQNRSTTSTKKKKPTCASGPNPIIKEHKVKVVGDSHLKKTTTGIDQFLTSKFEMSSWIKPGAKMEELVGTMEKD